MCDQNIAVSIRNLNQMSSIIPNRMEKLKLASLSAGIVAGFTTDCFYDADTSLSKGYDATVSDRVNGLSNVLKNYIVLNKSWYDSGARTISDIRNIFITGRKHPLNTLNNVFSVITRIEFNQNAMDNGVKINAAKNILMKYDLSLDIPFHRLLTNTREKGLLVTLNGFRETIIKSAKRITSDGKRLDILDERQLSTIISVVAGLLIGYAEPLPSTTVDFNEYYATTAFPFAASLTNELVEKLTIDTDSLFAAYRSTIEARYELTYEPVATVRGLLSILTTNDILSKNMSEAIVNSNKEELVEYIVGMVKGVYDVRKEHAERSVLHELDYLPIDTPFYEMFNKPESNEDIQKRMEEMLVSNESALVELNALFNQREFHRYRSVSTEAMTGTQKMGILFMVLGGALMAWAVYATFFKNAATHTSDVQKLRNQINKDLAALNITLKEPAKTTNIDFNAQSKRINDKLNKLKVNGDTKDLTKQIVQGNNIQDIKSTTVSYVHNGDRLAAFYDFSKFKVSKEFVVYSSFMEDMNRGLLEQSFIKQFNNVKDMNDMRARCAAIDQDIAALQKRYIIKFPGNIKGSTINVTQLTEYMTTNVYDAVFIQSLENAETACTAAYNGISNMNTDEAIKEMDAELVKNGVNDADRKIMGLLVKQSLTKMTNMFKDIAKSYLLLISNVRVWDGLVVKHLNVTRIILKDLDTVSQISNPAVAKIQL